MIRSGQREHPSYQLVHILVCSLLLGISAQAQVVADDKKELPPVELKLSTTSMMLCIGSAIPLNLELTNRGSEEIKKDQFDIWNQVTYGYFGNRTSGPGGGPASCCSPDPPHP